MDIETTLRESRAEALLSRLGFQTETGKTQFKHQLRKLTPQIGILKRRQTTISTVQECLDETKKERIDSLFQKIQTLEPHLKIFFERSEVETNSYEQLLFSSWKSVQVFNTIPFVLLALSVFKQYIVPALAVMTPFFMIIMPYVVLTIWYKMPITVSQYTHFLLASMGLHELDLRNPRTVLQGSITLFSLGQSIYQPIQNALHLQTIHGQLMEKAHAAEQLVDCVEALFEELPLFQTMKNPLSNLDRGDPHRLFAYFWDHPYHLRLGLQTVGDIEVVYRFAAEKKLVPVQFVSKPGPHLVIQNGIDPMLKDSVPFSIKLMKHHHAILTGPNRGGKSSVLRSTLLCVVLAQTFGMGFAEESILLRPFDWIATGLCLEDRPGTASMFESEVEFAIQILQRAKERPQEIGCILFDELFHSTNPPDGARTADIFLQKLWQTSNTASFISTHVFDLAKKAHKHIQKLCVPAHKKEDGNIEFTYTLQKGICEVSSVDLILKEKGLLESAEKQVPENPRQ